MVEVQHDFIDFSVVEMRIQKAIFHRDKTIHAFHAFLAILIVAPIVVKMSEVIERETFQDTMHTVVAVVAPARKDRQSQVVETFGSPQRPFVSRELAELVTRQSKIEDDKRARCENETIEICFA